MEKEKENKPVALNGPVKVAVLGAGSWGTALAQVLAEKGHSVRLWARNVELCAAIKSTRENKTYLPGISLSENILPSISLQECITGAPMIVSAVPSHGLRAVMEQAGPFIAAGTVIVSATKGIEEGTHLTPSGILLEAVDASPENIVILSGPSFAKEVSLRLPTALSAASVSTQAARMVQSVFSTNYFRVYTNGDVAGVELGGALKNVIAIASGICDGLGLGNNARAALITRGLAEIARMGVRKGANPLTFSGLSGLGDLVLTCTGALSRNYTVGFEIGRGRTVEEITGGMKMVAEGVRTSSAAWTLSRTLDVDMPITGAVYSVLYEKKSAREAVMELMARELKCE